MDQEQTVVGARLVTFWPLSHCSIAESSAVMHPYVHRITLMGDLAPPTTVFGTDCPWILRVLENYLSIRLAGVPVARYTVTKPSLGRMDGCSVRYSI